MMIKEHRLTVPATLKHIEEVCEFVSGIARSIGMENDAVYHCYLSIEEICTNVIEHGYQYAGNDKVVDVICQHYPDHLSMTVIDDAPEFNPLARSDPDPSAPLLEREGGGWGIYFVKQYMDGVYYRFENNRNHLTIKKLFQ